jgi:hypothetical protein
MNIINNGSNTNAVNPANANIVNANTNILVITDYVNE